MIKRSERLLAGSVVVSSRSQTLRQILVILSTHSALGILTLAEAGLAVATGVDTAVGTEGGASKTGAAGTTAGT